MPAPKLVQLAMNACITNIKQINDIGDIPFELIRPVLIRVENPKQLREIERASPQVVGLDKELWINFIKRDVAEWEKRNIIPKNPQHYFRLYEKLVAEAEAEKHVHEEKLRAAFSERRGAKEAQQMTFINKAIDPSKKKRKTATIASRAKDPSTLSFRAGSKTKMTTAKSVLERARREAKEANLFRSSRSNLSVPTHLLQSRPGQIRTVPQSMVNKPSTLSRLVTGTPISTKPSHPTLTGPSIPTTPIPTLIGTATNGRMSFSDSVPPSQSEPSNPQSTQVQNLLARRKRAAESMFMPPKKRVMT